MTEKPEQQYGSSIKDGRYFTYLSLVVVTSVGHLRKKKSCFNISNTA